MRPLGPVHHAASDAVLLAFGAASPWLLDFADEPLAFAYTMGVAAVGVVLNFGTDYPLGLVRLIPVRVHSLIEWTGPGLFVLGPWLLFPGTAAAWALTGIGVLNFTTNALTDWGPQPVAAR